MARMSKEERRAQIVTGMMRAMATHGYERATIQRIAAEIDITPGLIHYHFNTKQEILLATLDEIAARMSARYTRALATMKKEREGSENERLGDALHAWIEAHVGLGDGADEEAMAAWVAISCEATLSEEVREPFNQVIERDLAALIEALAQCPTPPSDSKDAMHIAVSLMAMLQGLYLLSQTMETLGEQGFAREQLERAALGMLEVSA
jgi:TetR/AcrR family transcriptional repressor of bet genes